eukprot:6311189-Amphidinium_carterae.1
MIAIINPQSKKGKPRESPPHPQNVPKQQETKYRKKQLQDYIDEDHSAQKNSTRSCWGRDCSLSLVGDLSGAFFCHCG